MKYELIKRVLEIKKIPISVLCSELGMTEPGYKAMLKNKSMKVSTLEKICDFLKISPIDILDVPPLENANINIALIELEKIAQKLEIVREDLETAAGKKRRASFTPIPRDPFRGSDF